MEPRLTRIAGAHLAHTKVFEDDRGFFSELECGRFVRPGVSEAEARFFMRDNPPLEPVGACVVFTITAARTQASLCAASAGEIFVWPSTSGQLGTFGQWVW